MNTDKLNETLSALETNLRNLKSAREQVEIVTESSDNLLNSVKKLLLEIERLSNNFKEREETHFKSVKNHKNLVDEINSSQKSFVSDIMDTEANHLKVVEKKLNAIVVENKEDFNSNFRSFQNEIKDLKMLTDDIKSSQQSFVNETLDTQVEHLKEIEKKLNAIVVENKEDFNSIIKSFQNEIKNLKTLTDDIKSSQQSFVNEVTDTQVEYLKEIEKQLYSIVVESKKDFNSNITSFQSEMKELKKNTENDITKIKEISVFSIEKQTLEISTCLNDFKSLSKDNANNIQNFEKKINNKFEANSKKQLIFFIILMVIIVSGFIFITINKE